MFQSSYLYSYTNFYNFYRVVLSSKSRLFMGFVEASTEVNRRRCLYENMRFLNLLVSQSAKHFFVSRIGVDGKTKRRREGLRRRFFGRA